MASSLAAVFLDSAEEDATGYVLSLEETLRSLLDAGRSAWPDVTVDAESYVRHLAERTRGNSISLGAIHPDDFFLACGCKDGSASAIRAFGRDYLSRIPEYLRRMRQTTDFSDEVRQILSEKLLVRTASAPPKIADYSGRGPLAAWLRVAAIRAALNLQRQRREEPEDRGDPIAAILAAQVDPERDYLRFRYADAFAEALRAAFAALTADQRLVLRLHFSSGLTGDQIASTLHVHRATVVRWIARARDDILRDATRHIRESSRLSEPEQMSLFRLLQSQLDISCSQLLG